MAGKKLIINDAQGPAIPVPSELRQFELW